MKIVVEVIKLYEVETEGGDTTDPASCTAHLKLAENMQSTEIERTGTLKSVYVENAQIVGPSDAEVGLA